MRVTVTGHSKGGALAPTLALWLKETQTARGDNRGWDDSGQATIRCVTFAGPTPGNAAFAKRIESALPDHHRIANDRDIVTHAWEKGQLAALGQLYPAGKALFDAEMECTVVIDSSVPRKITGAAFVSEHVGTNPSEHWANAAGAEPMTAKVARTATKVRHMYQLSA